MPFVFSLPLSKRKKQIEGGLEIISLAFYFQFILKLSTYTYMDFTQDELILESPFKMAIQKKNVDTNIKDCITY